MGTISPKDERRILLGCASVLAGMGALFAGIGFAMFKLSQWVFS
jgi:hypothetical protein